MLLRNKLFPITVFPVILAGGLLFGQSSTSNQQPSYQPGQQGKIDGGVIQPIQDNGQPQSQPANPQAQQPSAQQGQGAPQQNTQQPPAGQQGKTDNGLIMPIENGAASSGESQTPPPKSPNQPGDTVTVPTGQSSGQAPDSETGGVFVFKKQVEEVHLAATVVDDRDRLITNLDKSAFTVYENGQPQTITSFRHEDVPVALGIVIDNSGSMRDKRPAVNAASINLVRASNPQDEVFVVNFNDDYYLDQDYTDNIPKLKNALERYETRGGTALYDAVLASNAHLMKAPKLQKKVLFVVTDGEDDASLNTLEQTIRKIQQENGPTVYTIGILDEEGSHKRRAQRALREMAEATGGVAFFPQSLDEVNRITEQIAHDIRNQYTISYKPTDPQSHGGYRQVKVEAHAKGYGKLQVRTRSGYYAGQGTQKNSPPTRVAQNPPAAAAH